jgi:hypothetical protein
MADIVSYDRMFMHYELERACRGAVMAYFKALIQQCLKGLRKTMKTLSQYGWSSTSYLNARPPKYKTGIITTTPQ